MGDLGGRGDLSGRGDLGGRGGRTYQVLTSIKGRIALRSAPLLFQSLCAKVSPRTTSLAPAFLLPGRTQFPCDKCTSH